MIVSHGNTGLKSQKCAGFVLLLLALTLSTVGIAQPASRDSSKYSYFGLQTGLASMKVKDNLVMPVRYNGANIQFGLSYARFKPLSKQEVNLETVIGGLRTNEANTSNTGARYKEPRTSLYWVDLNYAWMHRLPQAAGKYRIYLGASAFLLVNARFNERWDNSAINYDGALSPLAFQGLVERDFKTWRKMATVSFSLNIPMVLYVMRPEFSGVPDFLDHERDFLSSLASTPASQWTGVWNFTRIKTLIEMTLPIRGENFMKFTYKWEYYSYQQPMKIQYGGHSFLFTLFTRL